MLEQFITGDVWSAVNKLPDNGNKIACIAYVTTTNLKLKKGDVLICDASEYSIRFGETSAKTIKEYYNEGVTIYSNPQVHAKLLLSKDYVVIGSANMSVNSAMHLIEAAIITSQKTSLSQARAFLHNLVKESRELSEQDIKSLLRIKVVPRPRKVFKKSKTRRKVFGNTYWMVTASELSDRVYNTIQDHVETTKTRIATQKQIEEDNIHFLRWRPTTTFGANAKEGDQVIVRYKEGKRVYVYPPSTILRRESKDGYVYFYHDGSEVEDKKVSWTIFLNSSKRLPLRKPITTRSRSIGDEDVKHLHSIWK